MKVSPEERAARRTAFRQLPLSGKLEYIYMYYRLPIALGLIALMILTVAVSKALTKKEVTLYLGYVNVAVGDELREKMSEGFVAASGMDTRKNEVYVYTGLYLCEDPAAANHQYSYASRMKIMAAVNAKQLDVVLMNREAYDIFSRSGYLLELPPALEELLPELYGALEPYLQKNDVILEDNEIEYRLNEADEYRETTRSETNALDISDFPGVAEFSDTVYFGVIANSPRLPAALGYAAYLFSDSGGITE